MNKSPQVAVVILNWNGLNFLKQNLVSVLDQEYPSFKIVVVDNGSEDGSVKFLERIKKHDKRLEIIKLKTNSGYVQGNNTGLEKILKNKKFEFAVLLNNDVKVGKGWLNSLIAGFAERDIGICTSKILLYHPYQQIVIIPREDSVLESIQIGDLRYHSLEYTDGFDKKGSLVELPKSLEKLKIYSFAVPFDRENAEKLQVTLSNGGIKVFSGSIKKELKGPGSVKINVSGGNVIQNAGSDFLCKEMTFVDRNIFEFDRELPSMLVDAGCGASMAIRTDLLRRVGLLKNSYFMYNEDTEISFRLARVGYKTKFVANSVCYHYFWGSSGGQVTERQTFYGTRNRLWFVREYFGVLKYLYFFARTFGRSVIWGMKSLTGDKKAKMFSENYFRALISSIGSYEKQ